MLTEELVRRGHDVTLFASGDSTTQARLIPTVDTALWRLDEVRDPLPYWAITLGEAYRRARDGEFDVVHSHLDFQAFACADLATTPTITTLHGRLDLSDLTRLYARFPRAGVVSISDSQRQPLPDARWLGTVYNAIQIDRLPFSPRGGDYLAYLGRISPEKGLDRAIRIARLAGLPLKVAARPPLKDTSNPVIRADWEYYEGVVQPLLRGGQVELIGEIGDAEKPGLLGNALALLFPIDWPEPFGLVMAEALACGTPVVARRRGSVPEVVTHGVTGLIGETDEELAVLCQAVHQIDRQRCRDEAERRFTSAEMARGYEAIYAQATGVSPVPMSPEPAWEGTPMSDEATVPARRSRRAASNNTGRLVVLGGRRGRSTHRAAGAKHESAPAPWSDNLLTACGDQNLTIQEARP
jgi:glycosyltransferase involved in cell wall biosynthesis